MGLYSVDKSQEFIDEGKTLITEHDSERYLKKNRKEKSRDELYDHPEPTNEFVSK